MRSRNTHVLVALLLILLPWCDAAADVPEASEREIAHLLDYIGNSECSFIRNGISYTGVRAREHIQRKYRYIKKKIDTAEQFIKHAATLSSITTSKYLVRCNGVTTSTGTWLDQELKEYRRTAHLPSSRTTQSY